MNLEERRQKARGERGFSLTELMIAMVVFTVIIGSVVALLVRSQTIFRAEQGVSEMDQNARLLIDFLTRDIQQAKENALGLSPKFRSIYSYNGPEGKTDEITIVSSDTESKIPSAALPLISATTNSFSARDRYVEVLPNGAGHLEALDVVKTLEANEDLIVSSVLQDGSVQFDFVRVKSVRMTHDGFIGLSFEPVQPRGVEPQIPYGSTYEGGAFTVRPVTLKRYFIDRKTDKEHPMLALSVDGGAPITIARNVVAFQLRYLEVRDGEVEGQWVKEQNIAPQYKTQAVEITMTARTEIDGDPQAERLITLASVVRPRHLPDGNFGSTSGNRSPGVPGGGAGDSPTGPGDDSGGGVDGGGPGNGGSGFGPGGGNGYGSGGDGFGRPGFRHETKRVGKQPRLGERLNR